jgi:hypothetical protein
MTTLRQIEANRQNAQKSTGPKTPEGKARSRRSALKHGLAGQGLVMPEDQEEHAADRLKSWSSELHPGTAIERWLVERVVMETIRIDRCKRQMFALLTNVSIRAEDCWEHDRRLAAETLADKLPKHPGRVRLEIEATKQGCELIIERWELLRALLDSGSPWNEVHRAMALDLLGVHPDLRGPRTRIDPPTGDDVIEHQTNVAKGQIERLTLEIEKVLDADDAGDRELAVAGLEFPSAQFRLLNRYDAQAHRRMDKAMDQLKAGRKRRKDSRASSYDPDFDDEDEYTPSSTSPPPEAEEWRMPKRMSPAAEQACHPDTPLTTLEAFLEALGPDYDIDRAMAKVQSAGKWEEWFGKEALKPRFNISTIQPPAGVAPAVPGLNCRLLENPRDLYNLPIPSGPRRKDEPRGR